MTIRLRINLLFALAALFIVSTGSWSIYSLRLTSDAFADSYRQQERLVTAQRVAAEIVMSTQALREYLVSGSGQALSLATSSNQQVEARLEELAGTAVAPSEQEAVAALSGALRGYQRTIERASFLNEKGQLERAIRLVGPYLDRSLLPDVQAQIERFIRSQEERATTAENRLARATRSVTLLTVGSVLLMAGLGAALYVLLRRWLVDPVERLTSAARELGSGNLSAMRETQEQGELETLARELASMADRLAETQSRLVEQERLAALGELTFSVAHNVRNPLASVRALAQTSLLHPTEATLKTENDREILNTVDRLDRWLKGLLQSLKPIRIHTRQENLGEVISEVVESLRPYAGQRQVELVFTPTDADLSAVFDRRHIEQALLAVITNAIEASPTDHSVSVSANRNDALRQVFVSIRDEGPGVPAELQPKLFTPYFTTKKGGTGLGLSLARRIASSHQGRLEYIANDRSGAEFEFMIPVSPNARSTADRRLFGEQGDFSSGSNQRSSPRTSKPETPRPHSPDKPAASSRLTHVQDTEV